MDWVLDFIAMWLCLAIILVATGWYAATVIAPRWPNWWKRMVIDDEPTYYLIRK